MTSTLEGPPTPAAEALHAKKHRGPGESFHEGGNRIASTLSDSKEHYFLFRDIYLNQRFAPAGRVQSAVGSTREVTPYNCYVSGIIYDSLTDGEGSIMHRLQQAAKTMQMGGGIGYCFSRLRPRGAMIKTLMSQSSGPVSWISPYSATGQAVCSAGDRRGAQMGTLHVWHPDIEEFIRVKQELGKLEGFNLSILITDEFMECVRDDKDFDLRWEGEVFRTVRARTLWETIMRGTWDWAEPGVLFIDRINEMNNLWYCEDIDATNPCGEQPLPPFGACLLGSFNLTKYVFKGCGPVDAQWGFDFDLFKRDIPHVVRAMDNVVDNARFPLPEQEAEAKSKRRMGLGVLGVANALEAMGFRYGRELYLEMQDAVLEVLRDEAYRASALLAKEKGPFPAYDAEKFCGGRFFATLASDVQELIRLYGLRNSHLLSIAPTGTISMTCGNTTGGIEPMFALEVERTIQFFEGPQLVTLKDYAYEAWGVKCTPSDEVTAEEHVAVLCHAQKYMDSAVSKTCTVSPDMEWEDFGNIYFNAWLGGAKGCTTYNPEGKRMGIIKEKKVSCSITGECE